MKHYSTKSYLAVLVIVTTLASAITWTTKLTSAQTGGGNNFFGAIYSSNGSGEAVNQNFFTAKEDVYMNGGPQNTNANGLPNGTYFFQVTDPSGKTLLSTDKAVCRQLKVVAGKIAGAVADPLCTAPESTHSNGAVNPITGTIPVQMIPFSDTPNNGSEYKMWLIRKTSLTKISPTDPKVILFDGKDAKTDNFKVKKQNPNPCSFVTLSGTKFFDANANGVRDDGEPGLAGVRISISYWAADGLHTGRVITRANGYWVSTDDQTIQIPCDAIYKVCEELPIACIPPDAPNTYWAQTAPVPDSTGSQCYSGIATDDITGLDFGDLSLAPAKGGLTLGFWSNKNGQAVMKSSDNYASALKLLQDLCLYDYYGKEKNPTDYNDFRAWLLNGNAVNMAYMLSVQLSATSLDVKFGYLSRNTIVDARSLGLGLVTIGTLLDQANSDLCAPGGNLTYTGNPMRQNQEIIKNALDAINNNRLPMATTSPAGVCYPPTVPVVP